jgi:hypothetical protein
MQNITFYLFKSFAPTNKPTGAGCFAYESQEECLAASACIWNDLLSACRLNRSTNGKASKRRQETI